MPLDHLLRTVWGWRWRLLLAAGLMWLVLGSLVWTWPRGFVADAIIAPAESTSMAASALVAPSPVAVPRLFDTRPGGNFGVYLGALRSAEAAADLAAHTPIIAAMTARRAEGLTGMLRAWLGLRIQADADDVRGLLERRLAITQSPGSLTWTLALTWFDRDLGLAMLRRLHAFAEAKVREDLAAVTDSRISALRAAAAAERDNFQRNALFELLAQQQRAALIVMADGAIAVRLVQAPAVELRASVPNRSLLLVLLAVACAAFCGMAAVTLALLFPPALPMPAWAERRTRQPADAAE
jgi:hypothetical protein